MSGKFAGRTILISGAATGMGRACALGFAREGARVVLFGLGGELLDEAAEMTGGFAVHGDVTREADVGRAVNACEGRIDGLINAAGIMVMDEPATVTDEGWEKCFAVNTTGAMRLCRASLPLLQDSGNGSIVNIASVAAFNASPANSAYAASKAALVAYTRSIAYAHGPRNVRANVVAPGWVRTPMSDFEMVVAAEISGRSPEEEFADLAGRIALRRIGQAEEIANCCLFLASDEASFVTGAVLVADGGGRAPTQNRAV